MNVPPDDVFGRSASPSGTAIERDASAGALRAAEPGVVAEGAKFLRIESKNAGMDPNFVIYDGNDQTSVVKEILKEMIKFLSFIKMEIMKLPARK